MSYDSNVFFGKELTCFPSLLDKYVSNYYNNTFGNALTWGFFAWYILRYVFYKFINAILKQMKYPEYLRLRITCTLWNFGFCAASFLYCYSLLNRNNIDITSFHKKILTKDTEVATVQYFVGFVLLTSYYAQAAFWEATQNYDLFVSFEYALLVLLALLSYMNGSIKFLLLIIYINNLLLCVLELSRIFSFQLYNRTIMVLISGIYFIIHIILSIFIYLFVDSFYIMIPMGKLLRVKVSFEYISLNIVWWTWLCLNIYNSAVTKLMKHYIWHKNEFDTTCQKSYIQCSLFPLRTDTAYRLHEIRKEIEANNSRMDKQTKKMSPAFGQLVKCAVSFRRKVRSRREMQGRRQSSEHEVIAKSVLEEIVNNVLLESHASDIDENFQ